MYHPCRNYPNAFPYDEDLIRNHFMCVQIQQPGKFWRAFSCGKSTEATDSILYMEEPDNWLNIWRSCISMFAKLLHVYAVSYYIGGQTDLEHWADIDIHYPQGISLSLGEILSDVGSMEDMLLRLSGRARTWRGTSMFFQYGKMKCTLLMWATNHMSWKIILPVELVKHGETTVVGSG